jgi:hypothetical protein
MKTVKAVLSIALVVLASFAQAQQNAERTPKFTSFRIDAGLGYATPIYTQSYSGGFLLYVEPKYKVAENIALGIRRTQGLLWGELLSVSATCIAGDYFFTANKFHPFAGLGLGWNTYIDIFGDGVTSNFDFMLRGGFEISFFRLTLSYDYGGHLRGEIFHFFSITTGLVVFN